MWENYKQKDPLLVYTRISQCSSCQKDLTPILLKSNWLPYIETNVDVLTITMEIN